MIKRKVKQMILNDIKLCEENKDNIKDSYNIYLSLCAKYDKLDKNFSKSIQSMGKVFLGEGWDYRRELIQIKEILNLYILKNEIPIHNEEDASEKIYNVSVNKLINKGNLGQGNIQEIEKSLEANVNLSTKSNGLKKLFNRSKK